MRVTAFFLLLLHVYVVYTEPLFPSKFNVEWNTPIDPGVNASMPLGNGHLAGNFWTDPKDGMISFYLASPSAWDENASLLKLTMVNVTISPNPFQPHNNHFNQTLDLATSSIYLTIGDVAIHLWIDASHPFLRFSMESLTGQSYSIQVRMVNLRPFVKAFDTETMNWFCIPRYSQPDVVPKRHAVPEDLFPADALFWYHRNTLKPIRQEDYFAYSMEIQGLKDLASNQELYNPTYNNTFGGIIFSDPSYPPLKIFNASILTSSSPSPRFGFIVATNVEQVQSISDWYIHLSEIVKKVPESSFEKHVQYWSDWWNRSRIDIATDFNVSRQYTLHRWLQAIQSQGASYPIKFNGMLFVAQIGIPADWRLWGSANWWQNERLAYWNMLPAGDGDVMQALFRYYNRMLPLAIGRSKIYWNESDSAYWPETQTILGLSNNDDGYGCPGQRSGFPVGIPNSRWNRYNINGGLDLSMLILDHYAYTKDKTVLQHYVPMIKAIIQHYRLHWPKVNESTGKQILFPSQSLETWECYTYPPIQGDCVTNPAPDVVGLHVILGRLVQLDDSILTPDEKRDYQQYISILPDIPIKHDVLWPGQLLPNYTINVENAELYAVHPYRAFTATKKDLDLAKRTYHARRFPCNDGWCQDVMDAALLGMAKEAQKLVTERAASPPAEGYRFPAFMPDFQDFAPSADHLSNMNTALQFMLMQPMDDVQERIALFPAWPCDWDVNFKLHGPKQTIIEGRLIGGKISSLEVTPASRRSDLVILDCQH